MSCRNGCRPPCNCDNNPGPQVAGPEGTPINVQPRSGTGENLCWGVAGGQAALTDEIGAPAAPIPGGGGLGFIRITVTNYSWLEARKLTTTCVDPLLPGVNMAAQVRVLAVTAVGRQVIGSSAGINSSSIDSESQNALVFGKDISPISSSNAIVVAVRNDAVAALNISADVEGKASQ